MVFEILLVVFQGYEGRSCIHWVYTVGDAKFVGDGLKLSVDFLYGTVWRVFVSFSHVLG